MGWTYINCCKNYDQSSGVSLSGDANLNIKAGDLLVAICQWYSGDTNVGISDGGNNVLTMQDHIYDNYYGVYACYSYCICSEDNPLATLFYTHNSSKTYRGFIVLQFRPSSGNVELDNADYSASWGGGAENPNIQSNPINTTGSDTLIVGGHATSGGDNINSISEAKIALLNADGVPYSGEYFPHLWWRIFDAPQTSIYSQATANTDIKWFAAGILAFTLISTNGYVKLMKKRSLGHELFNGGLL